VLLESLLVPRERVNRSLLGEPRVDLKTLTHNLSGICDPQAPVLSALIAWAQALEVYTPLT